MNRNVLWIFLLTAQLVGAGSLASFEATCGDGGCGGSFSNGPGFSFIFGGPFPGFSDQFAPLISGPPPIEFSVGTNGGSFFLQTGGTSLACNYSLVLAGVDCDADVILSAPIIAPDDRGHSLGDVVSVVGAGTAQGFFCYNDCVGPPLPSVFDLDVRATYQFTLTNPGTFTSFSWTGASFVSVPEPVTWCSRLWGWQAWLPDSAADADSAPRQVSYYWADRIGCWGATGQKTGVRTALMARMLPVHSL